MILEARKIKTAVIFFGVSTVALGSLLPNVLISISNSNNDVTRIASSLLSFDNQAIAQTTMMGDDNSTAIDNSNTLQFNNNTGAFQALREQYLSSWSELGFQSVFDIFIEPNSFEWYGKYEERQSNIFPPGGVIELYVEPVGISFREGIDRTGAPMYVVNMTMSIILSDNQGTQIATVDQDLLLNSYNKITELSLQMQLPGIHTQSLSEGDYTLTYIVTDGTSGESFEIVKDIRIASIVE